MDINEDIIKEEVSSFVSNLQRLLPKKKEIIVIAPQKLKLTRLSDVHAEAKSVFPKCFFGSKLVILREILDKVKLVQQYSYGKPENSYKCFTQLIHKEMEPKMSDDGLVIASTGCATATYSEVLDEGYKMKLTSRIRDIISSETEVVFEKENQTSVGSMSCSLKDVDPSTLRMVTQWMYKVVPDFLLGTELSFRPLAYPPTPDISISARLERPSFTLSSTASKVGFQVCLCKQFSPNLRIATVINGNTRNSSSSTFGLALHKNYSNGAELKIFVDSQRCGGFTFQKDILFYEPHNEVRVLRLIGSTLIDRQKRVRFGIGLDLDF